MQKLKMCKKCGAQMDISAKACPRCGAPAKSNAGLIIVGVVAALIIITAAASSSSDTNVSTSSQTATVTSSETPSQTSGGASEEESKAESKEESKAESKEESKVESKTESKEESKVESKTESKEESKVESKAESKEEIKVQNNVFHVGETLDTGKVKITFQKAEYFSSDNLFLEPEEGKTCLGVYFTVENTGKSDTFVYSGEFDCYADDNVAETSWAVTDNMLSSASLSPGRKTEGYVYFDVPENAKKIEIEYETSYWTQEKAIFIVRE